MERHNRTEGKGTTSAPGETSRDARADARDAHRTGDRIPSTPGSSSPIPGPGASNTGHSPRSGGSRSAGLDRDRETIRNPGESDVMNSAISGDRSDPFTDEDKKRGSINDPQPDRPDPEGVPKTGE